MIVKYFWVIVNSSGLFDDDTVEPYRGKNEMQFLYWGSLFCIVNTIYYTKHQIYIIESRTALMASEFPLLMRRF
jgi:hypothetical protein